MYKNYKRYFIKFLLALLFTFNIGKSFSQTAIIKIDKKSILIGEQINYQIFVQHAAGEKVTINIPDSIPHFDIIEQKGMDTISDGMNIFQQKIVFTSFDSGSFSFPALDYKVNDINANTDSFKVEVGYMKLDEKAEPRDIKNIIEVDTFNILWLIGGAILLLVLLISYFIYKYINKKQLNLNGVKKVDAYKIAMNALDKLQKENAAATIAVKQYHTNLAGIFKDYCGKVMQQNFLNNTTKEVLSKLSIYQLNAETAEQTAAALETGDATKFAKYHPSFEENKAAMNFIKNSITQIEQSRTKNT
jgi:hypothetical protein